MNNADMQTTTSTKALTVANPPLSHLNKPDISQKSIVLQHHLYLFGLNDFTFRLFC